MTTTVTLRLSDTIGQKQVEHLMVKSQYRTRISTIRESSLVFGFEFFRKFRFTKFSYLHY